MSGRQLWRQPCRIPVLSLPVHSLGLRDECSEIVEIIPLQGDMRDPLGEYTIMVDQRVATLTKQHARLSIPQKYAGLVHCSTSDGCQSMVGTIFPGSRFSQKPAQDVPDASGPYNHVAYLSIWYTTTPGSAIAARVTCGSWPRVCSYQI